MERRASLKCSTQEHARRHIPLQRITQSSRFKHIKQIIYGHPRETGKVLFFLSRYIPSHMAIWKVIHKCKMLQIVTESLFKICCVHRTTGSHTKMISMSFSLNWTTTMAKTTTKTLVCKNCIINMCNVCVYIYWVFTKSQGGTVYCSKLCDFFLTNYPLVLIISVVNTVLPSTADIVFPSTWSFLLV